MKLKPFTTKRIFQISAVVYLIAAIFSMGFHHFDEHFQIIEFAAYKLGLAGENDLPWEFHYQMRPALQPAILVLLYKSLAPLGWTNPFFVTFLTRVMSAILSLYSIKLLIDVYKDKFKFALTQKWFVVLSLLLWMSVYHHIRFSSENWSGNLFVIGFAMMMRGRPKNGWMYVWVGALFGLAFVIRYQAAFLVLGFGLWLWLQRKDGLGKLVIMALAFFAMVGVGVAIDRWYYGNWTLTTWNYLKMNILADRVSTFGLEPWYYYITQTVLDAIPPFSLVYVASFAWVLIKRPKSALTWALVPFFLIHFLIGHKEVRFLSPLLGLLPIAIGYTLDWVLDKYGKDVFSTNKWAHWYKKLFWIVNVVMLVVVMFRAPYDAMGRFLVLYREINGPTIMYYDESSPFGETLPYSFYTRPNIELVPYDIVDTILPETNRQVFLETTEYDMYLEYKDKGRLVYRSLPQWVKKLDFNGWVGRTTFMYVLEIEKTDEQ